MIEVKDCGACGDTLEPNSTIEVAHPFGAEPTVYVCTGCYNLDNDEVRVI